MASLNFTAQVNSGATEDPIRRAESLSIASIVVNSAPSVIATSTTTTTTIKTPNAAPIWSPSELYSAIANDTFFAFLEAFNLQLSSSSEHHHQTTADSLPTVIPINQYVDSHGKTLLHHACRFGKTQVVKALLYHGINALADCHLSRTVFHDAISSSKKENMLTMVQLLHDHEPRAISVVDTNGSHILHLTVMHGIEAEAAFRAP